jgi:hypothetical protein
LEDKLLTIRPIKREDVAGIDEVYRSGHDNVFSLPDLSNQITSAVVVKEGKIIAFGVVKVFSEAIAVLDLREAKVDRLQSMEMLMLEAVRGCVEAGITQLHVFAHDEGLAKILEKHYEFKPVKGIALVKELSNGEG